MENVSGAEMPGSLILCGTEFGLDVECRDGIRRQLRRDQSNRTCSYVGGLPSLRPRHQRVRRRRLFDRLDRPNHSTTYEGITAERAAVMGIDWMTRRAIVAGHATRLHPVHRRAAPRPPEGGGMTDLHHAPAAPQPLRGDDGRGPMPGPGRRRRLATQTHRPTVGLIDAGLRCAPGRRAGPRLDRQPRRPRRAHGGPAVTLHQWFWGSHGCALEVGHEPPCECRVYECRAAGRPRLPRPPGPRLSGRVGRLLGVEGRGPA